MSALRARADRGPRYTDSPKFLFFRYLGKNLRFRLDRVRIYALIP
uniref:Uncharacterized protein n=1 Tax=Candidatus Kentrum sp. TUN TaxID=2126343 RepID=A0A451AI52_9GAMM|nr:MAG: hypothetical protein BECKTUN1418F_GA0071002_11144 [Candidatus Kentron sp. TUN]VFK59290.1 MAG: hypothetical protein BECKTUN1418D_GA0071000_10994 [Candidatus Kentron sp. TUN]VFK65720.1 MAG: hypothetical protein BECKTUN1418E_GA0071001_11124 [Candidatus Kentron sp. TUN]